MFATMNRGILTIAVGSTIYGKLAINLLVSIKRNSKIPVKVIYNKSAFAGLEPYLDMFDQKYEVPNNVNPVAFSMQMKVSMSLSSVNDFDQTLYLDADTIICPKFKVDSWFDELKGIPFTAYNNAIYKLGEKPFPYYKTWAKPNDILKHFPLSKESLIPQINSSFLYWERGKVSDDVFYYAWVATLKPIKHEKFRGAFPDELAFNIGCALSGVMPHRKTYRPIHLYILSENLSKEYIYENFGGMSVVGKEVPPKIVQTYNDFADHHFKMQGLVQRLFFRGKQEPKKKRPTIGFYHVCMIGGYKKIVAEQIEMIVEGGLYRKSKEINVVCLGCRQGFTALKRKYAELTKIKWHHHHSINEYEFPTIKLLKEQTGDYYAWYIHTKGVFDKRGDHWRNYMNYYNLVKWKDAQEKLKEGYDIVGVKWMNENNRYPRHFSGNFYHVSSEYVKCLPPIETLNTKDRYQAEFWHGMGLPNYYSMSQIMIDHENKPIFK
jgi:hypothetical protein